MGSLHTGLTPTHRFPMEATTPGPPPPPPPPPTHTAPPLPPFPSSPPPPLLTTSRRGERRHDAAAPSPAAAAAAAALGEPVDGVADGLHVARDRVARLLHVVHRLRQTIRVVARKPHCGVTMVVNITVHTRTHTELESDPFTASALFWSGRERERAAGVLIFISSLEPRSPHWTLHQTPTRPYQTR